MICQTIFQQGTHLWLAFGRDPDESAPSPDANYLVLAADGATALIDPSGLAAFPAFLAALTEKLPLESVQHVLLSGAAPDVVSTLPLWRQLVPGSAQVYVPALGSEFLFPYDAADGVVPIPDEGLRVSLGGGVALDLLPAHYLHAPANFSVYDARARVLFTGDVGSAVAPKDASASLFVEDFASYAPHLEAFHARWMPSPAARDAWVRNVSRLDVDVIAPRRGLLLKGADVGRFLDWFSKLKLGAGVAVMVPAEAPPRPPAIAVRPVRAPAARAPAAAKPPAQRPAPGQPRIAISVKPAAAARTAAAPAPAPVARAPAPAPKPAPAPVSPGGVPASAQAMLARLPEGQKYRLITRSDFDGLACAVLLEDLDLIDDILFVHPKDMQDGNIPVSASDISTNLPYVPGIGIAFDHHSSETIRLGGKSPANHVIDASAPSAARVVYNHFGGEAAFPRVSGEMMAAVDKADSAAFAEAEVLDPKDWVLLSFVMDSRTGLGRFRGFRIPNYELMMSLIEACRGHTIDEIMELPDVKERVDLYLQHQDAFVDQIHRCSEIFNNVVVLDLRQEETIFPGNRFVIYALHPECNISMHVMWGMQKRNTVFAVGKSIFNRSSRTNVGQLMLEYGGGGHAAAGTCQVENERAQETKQELIERMMADG